MRVTRELRQAADGVTVTASARSIVVAIQHSRYVTLTHVKRPATAAHNRPSVRKRRVRLALWGRRSAAYPLARRQMDDV